MIAPNFIIREIEPRDNEQMARVVGDVIVEMDTPTLGTAYEGKTLSSLYCTYKKNRAIYCILACDNKVVGDGGIAQLDHHEENICGLQKTYFLPTARGKGLGAKMIDLRLKIWF